MRSILSDGADRTGGDLIALLLPTLETGGAERGVSMLARALATRGVSIDLVVGRVRGAQGHALVPPGVRLVELGTRRVVTSFRALSRYLRRERPAILLANLTHTNAMALMTRDLLGPRVRTVVVEHSTLSEFARHSGVLRHRLLPLVARMTYRRADAIVTVSHHGRWDLARIAHLPEQRIEVIHNAVPFDDVTRRAREDPPHPWLAERFPPVVLAVGSLRPIKDHATLLHAFAALREHRTARLAILGDGPERRRLERLVRALGLSDDVILPGKQPNPYTWIRRAACVAMTSRSEGHPTVLLEALMLGRAVVAVDRGGSREVLEDGRLGALTAPGDLGALAQQMARALDESERPVPDNVVAAHDPDLVASRYLRLLSPLSAPISDLSRV